MILEKELLGGPSGFQAFTTVALGSIPGWGTGNPQHALYFTHTDFSLAKFSTELLMKSDPRVQSYPFGMYDKNSR